MATREDRIAELEARLARRRPAGVRPWVGLLAGLGALYLLLFPLRLDLLYALAPRTPLTLGTEGAYRWDLLRSNRYVELHGLPTAHAAFFKERAETFVVVGLQETPVLVLRHALDTERWKGGAPPAPDPRPFRTEGRLLARADATRYQDGFAKLTLSGERPAQWLVVAGDRPGADVTPLFLATALVAFAGLNFTLAWRGLRRPPTQA